MKIITLSFHLKTIIKKPPITWQPHIEKKKKVIKPQSQTGI